MTPVLDPPKPAPREVERVPPVTNVCHLLTGVVFGCPALCGKLKVIGVYPPENRCDLAGHCLVCGRPRCPACMEFVT